MGDTCEKLLQNKQLMCLYFAAVLFLLLLIIMQLWKVGYYTEQMTSGKPYNYDANQPAPLVGIAKPSKLHWGGNGSRCSSGFSGANQPATSGCFGESVTALDSQQGFANNEPLVNGRGEPDFWTVDSEVRDYQRAGWTPEELEQAAAKAVANAQAGNTAAAPGQQKFTSTFVEPFTPFVKSERFAGAFIEDFEGPLMGSLHGN